MSDETEDILEEITEKVREVYQQASQEASDRLVKFLDTFTVDNTLMKQQLAYALIDEDEYNQWYNEKLVQGYQYRALQETIATDLLNADQIAAGIVNGYLPDVYAANVNQAQFDVCKALGFDFDPSFTLYDRFTVDALIKDGSILFPTANVDVSEDTKWIQQKITNSVTMGILQGESTENIAKRMEGVANMSYNSAVRTARTLTTSAQNAGRVESYNYAKSLGIDVMQEWLATVDMKTRSSHRHLDGEIVPVGSKFSNGLRYPGDPNGSPAEVYNCRCTLIPYLPDFPDQAYSLFGDAVADRWEKLPEGMTYDEWKKMHVENTKKNVSAETKSKLESKYVQGNDITRSWKRRSDDFDEEIYDAIQAQGFDGLPKVVSAAEFAEAVQASGFVAQRTYSAPDPATLAAYRDQLYHGEWYVDCSVGGAQYGQGMYCASEYGTNYSGNASVAMKDEIEDYIFAGAQRQVSNYYASTPAEKADIAFSLLPAEYQTSEVYSLIEQYVNTNDKSYLAQLDAIDYSLKDTVKGAPFGVSATETITLVPGAKVVSYDDLEYMKEEDGMAYMTEMNAKEEEMRKNGATEEEIKEYVYASYASEPSSQDIGAYAALKGYDAIRVDGHGKTGSYTVILNRTAVIIKEPEV